MDLILVILGVVLALWALADLLVGTSYLLPSIYGPGINFSREDDGPVFYVAVIVKLGGAGYLLAEHLGLI